MSDAPPGAMRREGQLPEVLSMRQRADVIHGVLERRFARILPMAMRETGLDMWLILCQEDDLDPVFRTMMPLDTWCPILQMLVLYDGGEGNGVERINMSGTDTRGLFDWPLRSQLPEEQWPRLVEVIEERDAERIGINVGSVQWAAGGLTHNLYGQLVEALPEKYVDRLESAEPVATRWLATLTNEEIELYEHVACLAHHILAECYSRQAITPGVTTVRDLEWYYWQRCVDLGIEVAFKPFFVLVRSDRRKRQFGEEDIVIRPGDFVRSDVGIKYLRLNTDHQQWGYVPLPGEDEPPAGMRELMAQGNALQDIFMDEFETGRTGNEMLDSILGRARQEGLSDPRVYSHSLGLFLHEPGPLIGLPWEQERCEGRGDVALKHNYAFTMELSVTDSVPEWGDQKVCMGLEEDVVFTENGCRPIDGRQTCFHVV